MSYLNHIQQRSDSDCGVACIAMLANVTYEEVDGVVQELEIDISTGMCKNQAKHILMKLGYFTEDFYNTASSCCGWLSGKFLVAVPSLNKVSQSHFVVLDISDDYTQILDPQYGREGVESFAPDFPFYQFITNEAMKVMSSWREA